MNDDKAIRAAKLTLGGILEKNRAKEARERAPGQIAPSKYMPNVPRAVHAAGGYVPAPMMQGTPRLAVAKAPIQSQQPEADFLASMQSLTDTAKFFKGEKDAPPAPDTAPAREPHAAHAEPHGYGEGISSEAAKAMSGLQSAWAGPEFGIVSGYRDPEKNDEVGGAKGSQHIHGNAFDVDTTGWSEADKLALADAAWEQGFRGFGFYDNNMHFDVGAERGWGPSYSRDSIPEWAQGWTANRYGYAEGGEIADLGQAREQKQIKQFHTGLMGDVKTGMNSAMEAHQKALDAGVFDGYEVGDVLQGSAHPMRITGRFMRKWKPSSMTLQSFDRMGAKPTIIEHEDTQYIPMLRYETGLEGTEGWQSGDAYLDGVKAAGYQKMGGLRSVKAEGGPVEDDQPVDLSLARAFREFNQNSSGPTPAAAGMLNRLADRHAASKVAYDAAHADGAFDNVQLGDVYKYKALPNSTPMKVVGHRMMPIAARSAPGEPKYLYHGHYPVADMQYQDASRDVKTYPIELMEDRDRYDFVSGKPRAVKKSDGGSTNGQQDTAGTSQARPEAGGLPVAGGVRGSSGVLPSQGETPLEGLPQNVRIPLTGGSLQAGPDPRIREIARQYMASSGLPYNPPTKYAKVDPGRSKRIAAAYDAMTDNPDDPLTKASYSALAKETMAQYQAAKAAGFKAEFWHPGKQEDPYKASPRLAVEDVRNNHHMWVYPTYAGYGSGEITDEDVKKNPMLQGTGEHWNGIPVTVNDVFRAIHDYYGHAKEGVGFRADGEENAWRAHASMFSPLARMAMTSETRGQNSWLNYGPHGEANRGARTEDTVFAPQKVGIMPDWVHHEGAEDFVTPEDVAELKRVRAKHSFDFEKALGITRSFTKDGKAATMRLKMKE